MDKETKQQIHTLQIAILEQGKTISNIMKHQEIITDMDGEKYNGWLISKNVSKRISAFVGYSVLAYILVYALLFGIGFVIGIIAIFLGV